MSRISASLENKVVIITGAASGIGRSTADLFLSLGASVFEIDIKYEPDKIQQPSERVCRCRADLTSNSEVRNAVEACERTYHRLDILANCAGIEMTGNTINLSEDLYDKVMNTNVKSIFLTCKHAIPLILRSSKNGSIINMASDLGIQPIPNVDAYAASKGAIIALTKAMSKNWAKEGLRVNCVAPGPIDTPLVHRFQDEQVLGFVKQYMIPMGRLGKPEEIAEVVAFLASDRSSFINGAVITANGGLLG